MGVNATTFVPTYVAGEVLSAADLNVTNSGIPVFADSTARDAAFGGTGEKVLAEGQYAFLESTNQTLVYDGASWIAVGASGLTLIKSQVIGSAVSSVTVTGAFSANYDVYYISIVGGVGSTAPQGLYLTLGSAAANYYYGLTTVTYAGVAGTSSGNNVAFFYCGEGTTTNLIANVTVSDPFNTKNTMFSMSNGVPRTGGYSLTGGGYLNDTTSYTAFTITPTPGTITGGTIRVYGYANS